MSEVFIMTDIFVDLLPMLSIQAVTFTVYAIVAEVSGTGAIGINQAFTSLTLLGILIIPSTSNIPLLSVSKTNI